MKLCVEDLSFSYGSEGVIENVSFTAESGVCTVLLGINGAGKSTLLKCIDGILRPDAGAITADGADLIGMDRRSRARICGYVSQQPSFSSLTVFDSVLLGRSAHIGRHPSKRDYDITGAVICELGLEKLADRNVNELSGGERQKTAAARALAGEPAILLLDEPTSNLDIKSREEITALICSAARKKNTAVVAAMHDISLAMRFADSFVMMKDRGVYSFGGRKSVNSKSIYEVYGINTEIADFHGQTVILPVPDKITEGLI